MRKRIVMKIIVWYRDEIKYVTSSEGRGAGSKQGGKKTKKQINRKGKKQINKKKKEKAVLRHVY